MTCREYAQPFRNRWDTSASEFHAAASLPGVFLGRRSHCLVLFETPTFSGSGNCIQCSFQKIMCFRVLKEGPP